MTQTTKFLCVPLIALVWLSSPPAVKAAEDPMHEQLRTLKRNAEEAFDKGDLDSLLKYVDKNVVATWQDGKVTRGHEGVRAYYERMLAGKQSVVSKVKSEIAVDNLSQLYGDTAVASGTMDQHFELRDGTVFDLASHWTATVVKSDDQLKIASFHVSASIFDNPILTMAERKSATWAGGIAGALGLMIGFLLTRVMTRKNPAVGT